MASHAVLWAETVLVLGFRLREFLPKTLCKA